MTEKKQILKTASIISLVTIVSRILGYVRDQRIVLLLGTSHISDSFFLAYRIPNLFRRLVGEGSMTSSFIPVFTTYMRDKSKEEVWEFANNLFWTLALVLACITVAQWIGRDHEHEKLREAVHHSVNWWKASGAESGRIDIGIHVDGLTVMMFFVVIPICGLLTLEAVRSILGRHAPVREAVRA